MSIQHSPTFKQRIIAATYRLFVGVEGVTHAAADTVVAAAARVQEKAHDKLIADIIDQREGAAQRATAARIAAQARYRAASADLAAAWDESTRAHDLAMSPAWEAARAVLYRP